MLQDALFRAFSEILLVMHFLLSLGAFKDWGPGSLNSLNPVYMYIFIHHRYGSMKYNQCSYYATDCVHDVVV